MSAPLDLAAQSIALDSLLGDDAAAGMPSAFELALFDGDPRLGGVEMDAVGGYARVTGITNNSTNFPDAVDGLKTCAVQTFADSTDAWASASDSDTAIWFVFYASGVAWFHGPLDDEVSVTEASTSVTITPRIYWNTED